VEHALVLVLLDRALRVRAGREELREPDAGRVGLLDLFLLGLLLFLLLFLRRAVCSTRAIRWRGRATGTGGDAPAPGAAGGPSSSSSSSSLSAAPFSAGGGSAAGTLGATAGAPFGGFVASAIIAGGESDARKGKARGR
jgi:hypothetical protein